jgi:5-methylcytosine-specific restriction protein A
MGAFHTTAVWRKLRLMKLARDPICELHAMKGVTVAAQEIHHLLPIEDYPDEGTNIMYLQSLCRECHNQIKGKPWTGKR